MTVQVLSTNVGELQLIPWSKSKSTTGIFKMPVQGPVTVHVNGLQGDQIGSKKHHGGPDQAVYIFSAQDYCWWQEALGRPLHFGTFGENLTVSSLGNQPPRIGDIWHIGGVVLQLCAPRIPCVTLAARMNDPTFVKTFAQANRGGAYARVLKTGVVEAGMEIAILATEPEHPTIDEVFALCHQRKKDPDALRRALASPLASRSREDLKKWLSRVT